MLLVNSGGPAALPEWRRCFAEVLPGRAVAHLDDPAVDVELVTYALVYDPTPGRLAQFPNLRLVVSAGAGVDHITKDHNWPRHVPLVRMASAQTAQRMSEYVCLGALALLRGVRRMALAQQARRWDHFETARDARQTTVGIMGLGNLGVPAALALRQLGFTVAGWSRTAKSLVGVSCYVGAGEFDAFLESTDILVCLLPGNATTQGVIDARALATLPRGASIVNASRGSVLDTTALLAALDRGHVAGAVLDVFDTEPLPESSDLWRHPAVLVTPHIAALASRADRARFAAEVISRHESGAEIPSLYDAKRGY